MARSNHVLHITFQHNGSLLTIQKYQAKLVRLEPVGYVSEQYHYLIIAVKTLYCNFVIASLAHDFVNCTDSDAQSTYRMALLWARPQPVPPFRTLSVLQRSTNWNRCVGIRQIRHTALYASVFVALSPNRAHIAKVNNRLPCLAARPSTLNDTSSATISPPRPASISRSIQSVFSMPRSPGPESPLSI